MGFSEAIRTFYARYTDFQGRSRRSEFWWMQLLIFLVALVLGLLAGATGAFSQAGGMSPVGTIVIVIGGLLLLAHFVGLVALQIRRFHDLNQTGWLVLVFAILGAIPILGTLTGIGQLIWFAFPGTAGPNKYGADPKDPHYSSTFD